MSSDLDSDEGVLDLPFAPLFALLDRSIRSRGDFVAWSRLILFLLALLMFLVGLSLFRWTTRLWVGGSADSFLVSVPDSWSSL